ncbi:MAG: transposase, partial [Prevotellaceae bacterium]|nr:transposase [Prevotellaceae bacterium]
MICRFLNLLVLSCNFQIHLLPHIVPCIQKLSAMLILSEIGTDMSCFPNASALVGWAGLRPRNDES